MNNLFAKVEVLVRECVGDYFSSREATCRLSFSFDIRFLLLFFVNDVCMSLSLLPRWSMYLVAFEVVGSTH